MFEKYEKLLIKVCLTDDKQSGVILGILCHTDRHTIKAEE